MLILKGKKMKKICSIALMLGLVLGLGACTYNSKQEAVHFDSGSYKISPKEAEKIRRFITANKADKYSEGFMIHLTGHTDFVGNKEYNKKLSENRVKAVRKVIEDMGVRSWVIRDEYYGLEKPIANNETVKGRALNRRVVISFLPVKPGKGSGQEECVNCLISK